MTHRFDPAILREYDIRGAVGTELLDTDAYAVGRSFASRVRGNDGTRVVVGRDGRLSSPMLETALVAGLTSGGVDVVRIGLSPSPMLYFAEAELGVDGGIEVTGSHNPGGDNGFKLVLRHRAFCGADIQDVARCAAAGDWTTGAGTVTDIDILPRYIGRLMAGYEGGAYRIGWDAGNGAIGPVIEALTRVLPGEHHLLFTAVDGSFPNHHPDPTVETNLNHLKALVAERKLDFGVAFDGDGDRIGAVDARGRVLWGDQLLAILCEPVLARHPGAAIVGDVKSSAYLFDRVTALGGRAVMAKTGHSSIKTRMRQERAPIAGELSGHIFFGDDFYGHDDAAYAAIKLIGALHASGRTLSERRDAMPDWIATPDLRLPIDPARKTAVVDEVLTRLKATGARVDRTDGARVDNDDGWWLLRASNTQDMLTIRAEAKDEAALARLMAEITAQLAASGVAGPLAFPR